MYLPDVYCCPNLVADFKHLFLLTHCQKKGYLLKKNEFKIEVIYYSPIMNIISIGRMDIPCQPEMNEIYTKVFPLS